VDLAPRKLPRRWPRSQGRQTGERRGPPTRRAVSIC